MLPTFFQPRKPFHHRARAGDQAAPTPPPDGPQVLHVVRATPSTYVFEFDRPVVASSPSGSNLTLNGMPPVNAGNLDATHVVIEFQQGGDLRFADPRTFGEMFVSPADQLGKVKELDHIAIDPLEDTFTWQEFSAELARRAAKLKSLLMDQKFISGLGNIYSDEVLFAAGLRHDRMSDSLSSQEVRRLYRAIREVVQDAIRFRGTTLADEAYVDVFGKAGEFQNELKVYGRAGQACRRCRTPIAVIKLSGRSSYYCPQCQPAPRSP